MKLNKILSALILSFLIYSCGSKTGSDSPANSVKDFVAALKEQKHEKAWNYLSDNSKALYEKIAKNRNQTGKEYFEDSVSDIKSLGAIGMDFDIIEERKSGDSAVVIIKTLNNGQNTELFTLREGGVWKLDYARSIEESIKSDEQ